MTTTMNKLIVFLLLLIPAVATAERPTLNIYYVVASNALPPEQLDDLVSKIKASFKEEFNVGIRTRVRYVKNNYIPYNLGTRLTQFNHWYSKYAAKQKRKWSLVITPPYYDNGQQYLAGLGHNLCFAKNEWGVRSIMAMMTAELYNEKGQDRYPHSLKGIMHELGHNLGFDHNASEAPLSIMHPNVLFYVDDNDLHFNSKERKTGRKCLLAVRKGDA